MTKVFVGSTCDRHPEGGFVIQGLQGSNFVFWGGGFRGWVASVLKAVQFLNPGEAKSTIDWLTEREATA